MFSNGNLKTPQLFIFHSSFFISPQARTAGAGGVWRSMTAATVGPVACCLLPPPGGVRRTAESRPYRYGGRLRAVPTGWDKNTGQAISRLPGCSVRVHLAWVHSAWFIGPGPCPPGRGTGTERWRRGCRGSWGCRRRSRPARCPSHRPRWRSPGTTCRTRR